MLHVMLFLHGMLSLYDRPPEVVEAAARAYAESKGYNFDAIRGTGDDRDKQERMARERIEAGGVWALYGFSMGGYTAARIRRDYPGLSYVIVGAPGSIGDIEIGDPERDHMNMPEALAKLVSR